MQAKTKMQRGFSLIELLVVVAIIGIVSAIVITNLNSQGDRQKVEAEARKFTSLIREMQSYALTGKKFQNDNDPCYYQLSWSSGSYTFIYHYKAGSDCSSWGSVNIKTYPVENGVALTNSDTFLFTLPHGETFIQPGSPMSAVFRKNSATMTVCIYSNGLVREVESGSC